MNKYLNYFKDLLLVILMVLMIIFIKGNGVNNQEMVIYFISILILLIISVKDISNKNVFSKKYNILFIVVILLNIFILSRTLFDTNFICNSKEHMDMLQEYNKDYFSGNIIEYNQIRIFYLSQNIYLLLILFGSLFLYRYIEKSKNDSIKKESKYSKTSVVCLLLNSVLALETFRLFEIYIKEINFPILFFIANTTLLILEIISLIRNNKEKKEWPLYVCFLFNLFAYIAIFT